MKVYSVLIFVMIRHLAHGDETSRSMKDPVVRHDVKQCGQYLCPAYPSAAETYIMNGCQGDFQAASTLDSQFATTVEVGIDSKTLTSFASAAALVAVILGFVAGTNRVSRRQGYLPVRGKPDPDF
uniref:Uncharacterized protein n=1 Tax=Aureoumbra lagunensis TaxID=44058 RepID=A0A7S3JRR8_9STRA|mmetsp:Transcript_19073/g.24729  ORF Transcript_19073/g.24729 Transcript_19073/m.24729 type:complete len:125 (-) Transcript_19073:202-576(-)